jgi:hypothetical protein
VRQRCENTARNKAKTLNWSTKVIPSSVKAGVSVTQLHGAFSIFRVTASNLNEPDLAISAVLNPAFVLCLRYNPLR